MASVRSRHRQRSGVAQAPGLVSGDGAGGFVRVPLHRGRLHPGGWTPPFDAVQVVGTLPLYRQLVVHRGEPSGGMGRRGIPHHRDGIPLVRDPGRRLRLPRNEGQTGRRALFRFRRGQPEARAVGQDPEHQVRVLHSGDGAADRTPGRTPESPASGTLKNEYRGCAPPKRRHRSVRRVRAIARTSSSAPQRSFSRPLRTGPRSSWSTAITSTTTRPTVAAPLMRATGFLDRRSREPNAPRVLWNTRDVERSRFRFADAGIDRAGLSAAGKPCCKVILTEPPNLSRHSGPERSLPSGLPSSLRDSEITVCGNSGAVQSDRDWEQRWCPPIKAPGFANGHQIRLRDT